MKVFYLVYLTILVLHCLVITRILLWLTKDRPLLIHTSNRVSQTFTGKSDSVSYTESLLLFPGSWCSKGFVCTLQESMFPQFCGSSEIKSPWHSKSDSLGILSPFAGSPGWEICCVSYNFLNSMRIWYNCSAVYGLSAWRLYGGVDGDLLQEGLRHMPSVPGLLQPETLYPWQDTAEPVPPQETWKHSKAGLAQSLWGLWVLVHTRFCLSPPRISGGCGVCF